jgi:hypothetical protein
MIWYKSCLLIVGNGLQYRRKIHQVVNTNLESVYGGSDIMRNPLWLCIVSVLAGLFLMGPAYSASVTWVVDGVFDNSYTVDGAFDFDADTNDYSNVDVNLWNGATLVANYGTVDIMPTTSSVNLSLTDGFSEVGDKTGNLVLVLGFPTPLDPLDSPVSLTFEGSSRLAECGNSGCTFWLNQFSEMTEGQVEVVPVPAAIWLFGSGLLGLVGIARRKKA